MRATRIIIWVFCAVCFVSTLHADETRNHEIAHRTADQTYLTFPEWFLVFSPEEYAYFLRENPSYNFPYWGHLQQFWSSYWTVYQKTREKGYDFNIGYHVMIMVIGISTTAEYAIKSIYGNTIGRLSGMMQTHGRTSEQDYGAKVAQEYVDFIKHTPWYAFDFGERFVGIYKNNDFFGYDFIRKTERKMALSIEYGVKYVYANIIGFFTNIGYEEAALVTQVELEKNNRLSTLDFPRYDKFKDMSLSYAKDGYTFNKIAGNTSQTPILVSMIGDSHALAGKTCIFRTKILSNPVFERCLLEVRIETLASFLMLPHLEITPAFLPAKDTLKLEHIFDF